METVARFDWRRSAPRLAVLVVAAHLISFDLGGPWLWEDKGDTAAFARNIVATGLATAWDGRTFLDSDCLVPRLFGESTAAAQTRRAESGHAGRARRCSARGTRILRA